MCPTGCGCICDLCVLGPLGRSPAAAASLATAAAAGGASGAADAAPPEGTCKVHGRKYTFRRGQLRTENNAVS